MKPSYPSYATAIDHEDDFKDSFVDERAHQRAQREQRIAAKRNRFNEDDFNVDDHIHQPKFRKPKSTKTSVRAHLETDF